MDCRFKILAVIISAVLIFSPLFSARQARAQLLTFETNPILVGNAQGEIVYRTITRIVIESLKRRLLTMVVDQIIGWIEGEGKPLFVTDWKKFLGQAANIAIGDLAYDLGLGFICSPFAFQVQLSVLRPPRFSDNIVCTLDDIVSSIESFYDDFRNGGWLAYAELWQPPNNYYGMVFMAMLELEKRTAVEREANLFEALAGGGFLGTRKCDPSGRFCTITTPGAQIGALAAKAIGSDIDWLINAQDLAAYIGAISDALINRLIRSGVEGLLSLTTPNKPESGFVSGTGPCAGLTGATLINCQALVKSGENSFAENQKIFLERIDSTLIPRQEGEAALIRSFSRQSQLVNVLDELYSCQLDRGFPEATATGAELQQEQILLGQLDEELFAASRLVTDLTNARTAIKNPPYRDTSTIAFYFDSVAIYLDEKAAEEFKTNKTNQSTEIQSRVGGILPDRQAKLQSCRGF